jgi:hypothetical protein
VTNAGNRRSEPAQPAPVQPRPCPRPSPVSTEEQVNYVRLTSNDVALEKRKFPSEAERAHLFDCFWQIVLRKEHKKKARKTFDYAVLKLGVDPHLIIEAMKRYNRDWRDTPRRFIALPDKWLYDERWDDGYAYSPEPLGPVCPRCEGDNYLLNHDGSYACKCPDCVNGHLLLDEGPES